MTVSAMYRGRDLNPHSHHWPKDFKSFVSTYSTTAADHLFFISAQNYCFFFEYARIIYFFLKYYVSNHS